jgi:2'-5' RNA ligase
MKRLFVAIHLRPSDTLLVLLASLKARLGHERINWVRPENMHLTLKFMGATPDFKIADINSSLEGAVKGLGAFSYTFDRIGIFGSRHDPRVLWLGMQERNHCLDRLAEAVINATDAIGFSRDRQNFVPHLTLGRIHRLSDKKLFSTIISSIPQTTYISGMVDEIVLYESVLQSQGPKYFVLERYPLLASPVLPEA